MPCFNCQEPSSKTVCVHNDVHVCDPCDRSRATLFPSAEKACLDCAIRVRDRVQEMFKENPVPSNQQLMIEMALLVHRKLLDHQVGMISQVLALKADTDAFLNDLSK